MGEIEVYVCEVCGKKYIKNKRWTSSHTCCRQCLITRKNKLERERRANERKEKKKDSNLLNEINQKAIAAGMTYGEYQAMLFLQKKGVRS